MINNCRTFSLIIVSLFFSTILFAQDSGKIVIESNVERFFVVVDNDFINYYEFTSGDTLTLSSGLRHFRIVSEKVNDNIFENYIQDGKVTGITVHLSEPTKNLRSSYDVLRQASNLEIYTDKNSSIFINDEYVGDGYSNLFLLPGNYDLFISNPDHGSLKKTLTASLNEPLLISRYNKNPKRKPFLFNLIPGGGYLVNKEYKKAKYTYIVLGTLAAGIVYSELRYDYIKNKVRNQNDAIISPENPGLVLSVSNKNFFTDNDLERVEQRAQRLTFLALGVYLVTTIDGLRKPKQGYWDKPGNLDFSMSQNFVTGDFYPQLSYRLNIK